MGYNTEQTEWPDYEIPDPVKNLIDNFFRLLDTNESTVGDKLADDIFHHDAISGFGGHFFKGAEEIRRSRDNAWKAVSTRRHVIDKVYVCNKSGDDLLFIGTVEMSLFNGKSVAGDFAGRLKIHEPWTNQPKLKFYQVWADTAPMKAALQEN